MSSVCGSLKCHLRFLKCSVGCLISGMGLQATSWPKVGPGSLSWCFDSSKCHFMTGDEHLPVLWSAKGLSFVAGPAMVVSEFRQHAVKLNFLLQIELQTWGSGSNSQLFYCSLWCSRWSSLRREKMMSDASDMLAAALEQMDGIIAGKCSGLLIHLTVSVLLFHTQKAEFQAEEVICWLLCLASSLMA